MRSGNPFILVLICLPVWSVPIAQADEFTDKIRPMLANYCMSCHEPGDQDSESPFLESKTAAQIEKARSIWKSVASQLRNRAMPPKRKKKQPTEQERLMLANWIEMYLQKSALKMTPYAGQVTTRRLNRDHYDNTIRDLVGLDLGFSDSFPVDGSGGEGFDNNGETLFLPPLLMERYLESAAKILDRAIIMPKLDKSFDGAKLRTSGETLAGGTLAGGKLAGGTSGFGIITIYSAGIHELGLAIKPLNGKRQIVLKIDSITAHRFKANANVKELKTQIRLSRGMHRIEVHNPAGSPAATVVGLWIQSALKEPSADKKKIHKRIFQDDPGKTVASRRQAATKIISRFASRAYRRPVTKVELDRLMSLYERSASRKDPFEESIRLPLTAVLVSPNFLFMIEDPPSATGIKPVSDYELATRLSYFLWSSMPDEQLLKLAAARKLREKPTLRQQVKRMIADRRSDEFFKNFTGQWLGTVDVGGKIAPVGDQKKQGYTSALGFSLRDEPNHLLAYMFRNDRSIVELIDADYVVINQLVAKHYRIDGVKGDAFRKVSVKNGQRGGVLGLGGVHMITSTGKRTSPVLRGAWVHETLLGTHIPSPPDNIPPLNTRKKSTRNMTVKQKLADHRNKPSCATCHNIIDPIGFGMENYDWLGRWREKEANGRKIDASGTMPTGEKFNGPRELRSVLLKRKDAFARHFIGKVLGYAIGRSLIEEDAGTIEHLLIELKKNKYSSQALMESIVMSTPFRGKQMVVRKKAKPRKAKP